MVFRMIQNSYISISWQFFPPVRKTDGNFYSFSSFVTHSDYKVRWTYNLPQASFEINVRAESPKMGKLTQKT